MNSRRRGPGFLHYITRYFMAFIFIFFPRLGDKLEPQLLAYATAIACQIRATSAPYTAAHGNARSLTHGTKPGIEPSWFLAGFISAAPRRELPLYHFDLRSKYRRKIKKLFCRVAVFLFYHFKIIVDLQCSATFCCTAEWPSYTYIYIHYFPHIILHPIPSQMIKYSSLHYTIGFHCLSTSNAIFCI